VKHKRRKLEDKDVRHVPLLARMRGLFAALRGAGAERDRAGNRSLHYDDYCLLILLSLFSPVEMSIRRIIEEKTGTQWLCLDPSCRCKSA
jgi:hypothetical protein